MSSTNNSALKEAQIFDNNSLTCLSCAEDKQTMKTNIIELPPQVNTGIANYTNEPAPATVLTSGLNDSEDAQLLGERLKHKCRFAPDARSWYYYDKCWKTDVEGMIVMEEAKKVVKQLISECQYIPNYEEKMTRTNHYNRMNNYNKLRSIMASCKSIFPLSINEFDTNNNMFNCQNGTTGFNIDAV